MVKDQLVTVEPEGMVKVRIPKVKSTAMKTRRRAVARKKETKKTIRIDDNLRRRKTL